MSEEYTPKFTLTKRHGRTKDNVALWVTMPDGSEMNIWDVSKKALTQDVLDALQLSFERGVKAGIQLCQPAPHTVFSLPKEWSVPRQKEST